MKMERTKNTGRNMVFGTVLRIYQILMPFVMRTVMIQFMGVRYLGLSGLFTSVLQVLSLAELGVGSAMVYGMYQAIANDDNDQVCALMRLYRRYYRFIGLAVLIIGAAIMPLLPVFIRRDVPPDVNIYVLYGINLAATVLSYWLFAYRSSLVQAHQREDVISKVTLVTNTVMYALQLVAIVFFSDYYLYTVGLVVGQVLLNVITALVSMRMYPDVGPRGELAEEERRDINQRIRDLFTSRVGGVVLNSADPIVISAFLGLEALAIYQNYYYIISALAMFFTVFFSSFVAGVGNSLATEDEGKNYRVFKEITMVTMYALGFCITCLMSLYQPFMRIWVGPSLMLDDVTVLLFCVFFFIFELCRMLNVFKDAAGIWHNDRFRPLVVSLLNVGLNIVLVNMVGLPGVLLSTIISYYLVNLPWLLTNVLRHVFHQRRAEFFRWLAPMCVALVVATALSYGICALVPLGGVVGLVVRLAVCVLLNTLVQLPVYARYGEFGAVVARVRGFIPGGRA